VIGLDTHILLRLWLDDEPKQRQRIDALLAEHGRLPGSLLVTDVVLAQAIWTLKSVFAQGKADQVLAVRSLLDETAFALEDRRSITRALELFEQESCGFAGCLVVAKHAAPGCKFTATLDRGMRKLPGTRVL
jgi:predicted nucleic-acid-binding protein